MPLKKILPILILSLLITTLSSFSSLKAQEFAPDPDLFLSQKPRLVQPVENEKCLDCGIDDYYRSRLSLNTYLKSILNNSNALSQFMLNPNNSTLIKLNTLLFNLTANINRLRINIFDELQDENTLVDCLNNQAQAISNHLCQKPLKICAPLQNLHSIQKLLASEIQIYLQVIILNIQLLGSEFYLDQNDKENVRNNIIKIIEIINSRLNKYQKTKNSLNKYDQTLFQSCP
jgi:hypothetical protein